MKKILISLTALLAAAACGGEPLVGVVTDKSFKEGYTYIQQQPQYTSVCSGTPVTCRQQYTGTMPIVITIPPCYRLHVRQETNEGSKKRSSCVRASAWKTAQIGDYYEEKS